MSYTHTIPLISTTAGDGGIGLLLARINRTIEYIDYARQRTGETEAEYLQRLDDFVQKAPAGVWSQSFFAQVEAAFQSDTGRNPSSGIGRNKDV